MIVDVHGHYHCKKDFVENAKKYAETDAFAKWVYGMLANAPDDAEEATSVGAWIKALDQ